MMQILKDRTVLFTGTNRGIGKAIVEEFLKQQVKKVYAAARNLETLNPPVSEYTGQVVPLVVDMNHPETIGAAAEQAPDVEIVVNNAGMLNVAGPLASNAIATDMANSAGLADIAEPADVVAA
jgi:NADP-dependent 3-hydroxy acid dehydrogenase YdfG